MAKTNIIESYRNIGAKAHRSGFNCSQSVLFTLAELIGLDQKIALKISSGFGGGMKNSEVCGAVAGAIMAIGYKYGYADPEYEQKEEFYDIVRDFTKRFKAKHHTLTCIGLLGIDISREAGMEIAIDKDVFFKQCTYFIQDAVEIALEIFESYDNA